MCTLGHKLYSYSVFLTLIYRPEISIRWILIRIYQAPRTCTFVLSILYIINHWDIIHNAPTWLHRLVLSMPKNSLVCSDSEKKKHDTEWIILKTVIYPFACSFLNFTKCLVICYAEMEKQKWFLKRECRLTLLKT